MIVKCIKDRGSEIGSNDPLLTIGKKYLVLSICVESTYRPPSILIICDEEESVASFPFEYFDIIDSRLPEGWEVKPDGGLRRYRICPKEFSVEFWLTYHEGERYSNKPGFAGATFDEVVRKICRFHGWNEKPNGDFWGQVT